ncbi:aspartate--tRNA ligase [Candidatus Uhrbacteria bacterium]|nr:aspartate--tRNA ligase [Candidatus Uhrbacteria bacterium]
MKRTMILDMVDKVGEEVWLKGWVHNRRDMGKLAFIDMRDRSGLAQVVFVPAELDDTSKDLVGNLRPEFCIAVRGIVNKRGAKQINETLPTGTVEVLAKELVILNESKTPPFGLEDTAGINEELRLKYRYLDLRSPRMLKNLILRDNVNRFFREYLHAQGFIEVETPILTKGTPEGAREFLVPSRLHEGQFYVLPQSPQQFKQLLMVGGVEKYFQIARCFRDEDQRGDRQPEFTQLDMEMSFVEREDVMQLVESMMIELVKAVAPEKRIQQVPFPRLSYAESMEKYGNDKPDLREDKNDPNLLAFCWVIDFPFFEKTDEGGWTFSHNPFSAPKPEHMPWLMEKTNVGEILTTQYDIVLNGFEAGGGSIRNHQPEALQKVFEVLGFGNEEIQSQFGHMIEAFGFGAPPHGGIAPGIDRIVMILANEPNIREVIPIPKTGDARDMMMGAPSPVSEKALEDAHISIRKPK